jgi:Rieske Fe-S protein
MVADCPCHGSKYHNYHDYGDTYPNGDPEGRVIEDFIIRFANIQIDLYAIKIT